MPGEKYFYGLMEAEKLKQIFSSWINKTAHAGNGRFDKVKNIVVKPKRSSRPFQFKEKVYSVHFEFENDMRLNAHSFLAHNGLSHLEHAEKEITNI